MNVSPTVAVIYAVSSSIAWPAVTKVFMPFASIRFGTGPGPVKTSTIEPAELVIKNGATVGIGAAMLWGWTLTDQRIVSLILTLPSEHAQSFAKSETT